MDFPRFVFISPGKSKCQGGTYDGELVQGQSDYEAALKAGYSATLPEALVAGDDARTLARAKELETELSKPAKPVTQPKPAKAGG